MSRWRNRGLWVAILAFIPLLVSSLTDYGLNLILPGNYEALAEALLGILVLAGIISNPQTESKWWKDDQ